MNKIRQELEILEATPKHRLTEEINENILNLKEKEMKFLNRKVKGAIIRTKIPHMEDNDISISYVSKLEKLRGEDNTIYSLKDKKGDLQEGTESVSKIIYDFYKELYSKEPEDEHLQDFFLQNVTKTLSDEERDELDEPITEEELYKSLLDLKSNKSPGGDALTKEFYSFFWEDLKTIYQEVLQEVEESKELTESQKKGLIRITYKKNGREFIKNYRPITLLNVDLKVLTKTLAKRMIKVLPKLIHKNQKCVPGRQITTNIHILQDLIDVINENKEQAAIIFIDQEKAFDRMSHKFIIKTLKKFGFGKKYINWINIILSGNISSVKVNGYTTDAFSIERGIRQGCPLSALLYVLCSEVLDVEIRRNPNVVGYKYGNNRQHKIGGYADDKNVCITSQTSIYELFDILDKYEKATNARINVEKTEALWVGNWKNRRDKPLDLKWTNAYVKCLGIYVGNDRTETSKLGFEEIKEKIKGKIIFWKGKGVTMKGRIRALNIFILSKLWYVCETQDIPINIKLNIERMITDFIWNGKMHQRNLKVLHCDYLEGGLRLEDISAKTKAYRIKWLNLVINSEKVSIERWLLNKLISDCNGYQGLDVLKVTKKFDEGRNKVNNFYKNTLKAWQEMNVCFRPGNLKSIKDTKVYNNMVLLDNEGNVFRKPRYYGPIRRLPNMPNNLSDLPFVIMNRTKDVSNIIKSMNNAFKNISYELSEKDKYYIIEEGKEIEVKNIKYRDLYWVFIKMVSISKIWEEKWYEHLRIEDFEWKEIWVTVHDKMLSYRVQSSLWQFIHQNFICPYSLNKMYNQANTCSLCKKTEEGRFHIFISCEITRNCYRHFAEILFTLEDKMLDHDEMAFGITGLFDDFDQKLKLRNYITASIKHIIFVNRAVDYENNIVLTTKKIIKKIRYFILKDLDEKYMLAKQRKTTRKFEQTYLMGNILGRIENEILILNI